MRLSDIYTNFKRMEYFLPLEYDSRSLRFGEHKSRSKGAGVELEDIRELRQGEPIGKLYLKRMIKDPKGRVFVVEKKEPKINPVILVIDLSSSMLLHIIKDKSNARLLLELIGIIGLTCRHFNDPFGVVGISDRVEISLTPRARREYVHTVVKNIFDKLEDVRDFERYRFRRFNFNLALENMRKIKKGHCVVFLSDFVEFSQNQKSVDEELLKILSVKHTSYCVFLDDTEVFKWGYPLGLASVRDVRTGKQYTINSGKARQIRNRFVENRENAMDFLKSLGIPSVCLSYGAHFKELSRFFYIQRRLKGV